MYLVRQKQYRSHRRSYPLLETDSSQKKLIHPQYLQLWFPAQGGAVAKDHNAARNTVCASPVALLARWTAVARIAAIHRQMAFSMGNTADEDADVTVRCARRSIASASRLEINVRRSANAGIVTTETVCHRLKQSVA